MAKKSKLLQQAVDNLLQAMEQEAQSSLPKEQALLQMLASDTSLATPGALSNVAPNPESAPQ